MFQGHEQLDVVLWRFPVVVLGFPTVHCDKCVTLFYYCGYQGIGIHLRRKIVCGSIAAQVRLGGEAGTQEPELERTRRWRYILNYLNIISQQKWNHLCGWQQKVTMTQAKSDSAFLWAVFSFLPCWCSDEVPNQSIGQDSRSSGGDSLITGEGVRSIPAPSHPGVLPACAWSAWLQSGVELSPGSRASWDRALQSREWDTSIHLSCWLWNLSDYLISVTHSILWGVSQFMHCVEKYFIKVLNSAVSFDTALLFELEGVNSNSSLCISCQLSPLHHFSLPGTGVPSWLTTNHIKALIQSLLCPLSLLSTFSYAIQFFLAKD